MARSAKPGDGFPLTVVRKENPVPEDNRKEIENAAEAVRDTASKTMEDIAEQLKALRQQVQALQSSSAEIAAQAGKMVASSARVAGDKIASGAREAGDKVASGARVAGEKVTTTVEHYPFSAVLVAAGAAFLLGRMSASSYSQPSYAESTLDQLKHRLHDLSSRLPPHLKSALRSSLR